MTPPFKLPRLHIPGCPHRPTLKQWIALSLPSIKEMLYGGAVGGGKSDFLLMAALQYIDVPRYSAVIFRRTFTQLNAPEDGMMARAEEWLRPHPDFNGIDPICGVPTRWKHRTGGTLSFSHLQYEKDKYNHQGPSYQFIGWDELTQFLLTQYLYLLGRLRSLEGFPVPLRIRSASNPGSEGHEWVRDRFPIPRYGNRRPIEGRCFVPAMLADNPHLNREEYALTLAEMHPYDREQLLNGNWDVRPPGGRFKREWFSFLDSVPGGMEKVRRWDLAATEPKRGRDPDYSVGALMGKSNNGGPRFVLENIRRFQKSPAGIDTEIVQCAHQDGRGVKIRMEQEPGSSGKIAIRHFRTLLEGFDFKGIPSTGSKVVRSNAFASAAEGGEVALLRADWNEEWLREMETFTGDDKDCPHDDQVDSSSGAHTDLTAGASVGWEDVLPPLPEEEREVAN